MNDLTIIPTLSVHMLYPNVLLKCSAQMFCLLFYLHFINFFYKKVLPTGSFHVLHVLLTSSPLTQVFVTLSKSCYMKHLAKFEIDRTILTGLKITCSANSSTTMYDCITSFSKSFCYFDKLWNKRNNNSYLSHRIVDNFPRIIKWKKIGSKQVLLYPSGRRPRLKWY